jgi:hypothetical protein
LNKETGPKTYRHPAIHAVTFNTRGMHNTILDLNRILNSITKPSILYLTETEYGHIKSIWREALRDYKRTHTSPKLYPTTNRRSAGTILATRRDVYKVVAPIPTPAHLTDYIKAATITSQEGIPIIAITAYMSQIHTKEQEQTYKDILTWIQQNIRPKSQASHRRQYINTQQKWA